MSAGNGRDPYLDDDGNPDASTLIGDYWPSDGPHNRATVAQAALGIDELVHYLARATFSGSGLRYGCDIYRVVGELRSAMGRLDQVLDQVARRTDSLQGDSTLYDDRGPDTDPGATAAAAAAALRNARRALPHLVDALARAHNASGHLGHHTPTDPS